MADPIEVGEFLAERAREDPKLAEIIHQARIFDELRESVGWRRLYDKVRGDKDHYALGLANRLMSGDEVNQRQIDFHRGFYHGAMWILGHPEEAMNSLEKAATRAYTLASLEISQDEEDRPYE